MSEVAYLVELPHIYDGWSVKMHSDGSMTNRWADEEGKPREGYERRWRAAQDWIESPPHADL